MIQGRITDSVTNQPLPFATVFLTTAEGIPVISSGTVTDGNGYYSLIQAQVGGFITCSYVSYLKQTVRITSNPTNLQMKPQSYDLNEVVITGKKTHPALAAITLLAIAVAVAKIQS